MDSSFRKIVTFIKNHHVLSLATHYEDELSVCTLFYVFNEEKNIFIVASSKETTHIKHILKNPTIAGNILLETKTVGEIKGLQLRGKCSELEENILKLEYFKTFPYALALNPTLWKIEVEHFKLTDNTLGFGKKILWSTKN